MALNEAQCWLRDATEGELKHWMEAKRLQLSPTLKIGLQRQFTKLFNRFNPRFIEQRLVQSGSLEVKRI